MVDSCTCEMVWVEVGSHEKAPAHSFEVQGEEESGWQRVFIL